MWYQLEASRAVNQAIGRVIRHRNDYGAILLCDTRFGSQSFRQQLSAWLQPHMQPSSSFGSTYKGVIDFFKKVENIVSTTVKTNLII
jgi:regulator of telomere elongation helicase 1